MDINLVRGLLAVAALIGFAAIAWWAYTPSRASRLDAIARSIVNEAD
jgi:cbb3-type cytochrome oxidase subunit 3